MKNSFDVIVVGGGHAALEAINVVHKFGLTGLIITHNKNDISKLSCNPAIGGLAKGHIVREIDALGGVMGILADKTGIQFRMLNKSKGAAVWGPRAQIDKDEYQLEASNLLKSFSSIKILEDSVIKLVYGKDGSCVGVSTEKNGDIISNGVIICCGTFLNGLIHIGSEKRESGRIDERNATGLTEDLVKRNIRTLRLKTGTPARIKKESINYSILQEQFGDFPPTPFSFQTKEILREQVSCYITRTTEETHKLIRENFHLSPMAAGEIKSIGPRYCPSIETKLINFPDKESHQLFIEPEGYNHPDIYLNGFSNCFPLEFQQKLLQTIPGLENSIISKPAYAIEYDFFPPTQLYSSLESKIITNLFFAGQINGTSGYEEAAAQGLMAGINCCLKILNKEPLILKRSEAYIGVLIDDLVTKGTEEPYRMFTSRAEFRLLLRQDNADERLLEKGYNLGLNSSEIFNSYKNRINSIYGGFEKLKTARIKREKINPVLLDKGFSELSEGTSAFQILKRPEFHYKDIKLLVNDNFKYNDEEWQRIEILTKYEGYFTKEASLVKEFEKLESFVIPKSFDYSTCHNLSIEAKEKLKKIKPDTIGQAARISGVSPADIQVLMVMLKNG